jgi:hypothetical protein
MLSSFLDDLKSVLEIFVNDYIDVGISADFTAATLLPIFRYSFPAAKRSIMFAINRLNEPDQELLRKLDDHGFRGQSLILKMEIVNVRKKILFDEINKAPKTPAPPKATIWSNLKNKFSNFLKAADIPLESLADCIPALGLALEFKKTVELVSE